MVKQKRWRIKHADKNISDELFRLLKIHPQLCNLLAQRGIDSFESAKNFFRPQLSQLHSPWLMKDMDIAVQKIFKSIKENQKILVFW